MLGFFESAAVFGVGLTDLGADFETDGAGVACGFGADFGVGLGEGSTVLLKKSVPFELFWVFPTWVGAVSAPSLLMMTMSLLEVLLADAICRPQKARADAARIERDFFMLRGLLLWCRNRFFKHLKHGIGSALLEFGVELGSVVPHHAHAFDDDIGDPPTIDFFKAVDDIVSRTFVERHCGNLDPLGRWRSGCFVSDLRQLAGCEFSGIGADDQCAEESDGFLLLLSGELLPARPDGTPRHGIEADGLHQKGAQAIGQGGAVW